MKSLMKFWIFLCIFSMFSISYAAAMSPENVEVVSASDTSISLDWDDVNDSQWYFMYYGTQTWSWESYEVEWVDIIEESEFILEDLLPDTRYYIAVTSLDEFGAESDYSSEIEYVTLTLGSEEQATSFRITEVQVRDDTSIELIFSTDLDTNSSSAREFLIRDEDSGQEIGVDISDILEGNPRNVIAVLSSNLTADTLYQVTVLDIRDASGNTIEAGIDAFINFTTPLVFTNDLPAAGTDTPTTQPEVPTDTEASTETETTSATNNETVSEPKGNGGWVTLSSADLGETVSTVVDQNEKLPVAGPEHWLLAFIALLMAWGIYYITLRKHS